MSLFETIGLLGGLYYFFHALYTVQAINTKVDTDKKLKEIKNELDKLNI